MTRSVLLIPALLGLAACGDPSREPAPSESASGSTISEAADDAEELTRATPSVRPGVSLDRLLASRDDDAPVLADLRAPRATRTEAEPNRHVEGQVDTVRTYVYDGMVVEAYEITGGRTFIQRVTVTGGGYETASGLSPDARRSDVEAVLGAPVRETGRGAVYETDDGPTSTTVTVTYEPDEQGLPRATSITWEPYVD